MNEQQIIHIELDRLRPHPMNSNAMGEAMLAKLTTHIERTGRYPPLIVRREPGRGDPETLPLYQVLDGHHRWAALGRLGHKRAACVVWEADDEQALVLLSTLNRLEGRDDPRRRAAVIERLREWVGCDAPGLARLLPESSGQVRKYLSLSRPAPAPATSRPLADMPAAIHFFLTGEQRRRLETALRSIGGTREEALMEMAEMNYEEPPRRRERHAG